MWHQFEHTTAMAKSQASARVPKNIEEDIASYRDEQGLDGDSEAVRQLIEQGIAAERGPDPGERLAETGTAISGVGGLVAALGAVTGSTVGLSLVVPFLGSAFVFAVLWASIRALGGGALR